MQRRFAVVLIVFGLSIDAGCSATAEQVVIGQFFAASRLRDLTSLQNFATVAFEPAEQGTVSTFDIVSVTPERRTVADVSVNGTGGSSVDVTKYEGELVSKDVTILAPLRPPDGPTLRKTLVITMQRAILRGDKAVSGRWVVTGVRIAD